MGVTKAGPALLCSFTVLPLVSAIAHANESGELMVAELDPIVVTATLGPRTVGESLSSVTVVSEEELAQRSPTEFSEVLRGQPGINVISNGSFGKNISVYTRGTGSESTLFMIDGVRLRSATSGSAPWQFLPVDLVERVEIVRGPKSSLYGADAVGGVVQAFTVEPTRGNRGWVELGGGSFDTGKGLAGVSFGDGSTRASLSGLHQESDGTAIVEEGEDRGYRNSAGVARVVHDLDNGGQASAVLMQSEGNTEFEGGNTDFMIRTLGLRLETPISDQWRSSVLFSEARDEQETFNDSYDDSVFDTRTLTGRWENTFTMDVHELVVGTELVHDEVSGTTDFDETSRFNTALFSQLRLNFGPTDLQFSLRADDNEAYGKRETGGVALGHAVDRAHRLRLSYGTAFRAPTFNELYYPLEVYNWGGSYSGNPDLAPEESDTVELGFSGRYQHWFWDIALYQLDVENLIALDTDATGRMAPANVDNARIRGLELASGFERDGWNGQASVAFSDPRDRQTDNRLRRRSAQTFRLALDKQIQAWSLGGTFIAEGYRYDDAANDNRLPGYGTLDLRAGWQFAPGWSSRLTVANVFDKEYATAERSDGSRYVAAGRTAMLSVRYDFQ
ncbi:TonB-dependent receptor domain-containing protein [Marinobacter nauticus]|jgi:vitamin B12 transporter|uniref:Outer membrane vitamin B12 receptor BtuB n=1 Tax=Marinobacter nauticus TaxID=2743 RepID=A0A833JSM6_MARNT|nr:TonB-dependent receptor [Marinobacter nauticus]KAE8547469.1 Outer membrane vitamin B12 receptor BtuB [Marinobacter nauticus]